MKTPLRTEAFVHFDDGDPAGIVMFANYFRMAHRALELALEISKIPWSEWYDHPTWGVPLRHVEADYRQPLKPGQKIWIDISVIHLGDSSVKLRFELKTKSEQLLAVVKTTHVFINKYNLKKLSIPNHLRAFLSQHLLAESP